MNESTLTVIDPLPAPMGLAGIERIETTREEALAALTKYRAALKTGGDHPWAKEDAAIVKAYAALAKGRPVIDLGEAMKAGGVHPDGLPKFAVIQSDARECWVDVGSAGRVEFRAKQWLRGSRFGFMTRPAFPDGTLPRPEPPADRKWYGGSGRTVVPMVPAPLRPVHALSGYLTLWEVEQWTPAPPRDPFLLKWLGCGFLCAVIAMWNLTPLERAAMRSAIVR